MRRASDVAREVILPALERLRLREPNMEIQSKFTLLSCHGWPDSGLAVSRVLQRPVRCFEGLMEPVTPCREVLIHALEQRGGIRRMFSEAQAKRHLVNWAHYYGEPMNTT